MKQTTGDELLKLLGLDLASVEVQAALEALARGMQPNLEPEDGDADAEERLVDWITINEIGLELGFQDTAYVLALPKSERHQKGVRLTQLYFYGDTICTQPFPYPLPFGLSFSDDRASVRLKLSPMEDTRRSFVRDTWTFPTFRMTVAYYEDSGKLESILCYVPEHPWPHDEEDVERVAPFTPERLLGLFGLRWSSAALRTALADLGFADKLGLVRSEHAADLRTTYGVEFGFGPGRLVQESSPDFPDALALASVSYYGPRFHDAREWLGEMPLGLRFDDSQKQIAARVGRKPDEQGDFDRNGYAIWHLERFSLRAEYSNIENRLLRATLFAPGYWARMKQDQAADAAHG